MLILFDHSTPAPLRYVLKGHTIIEAVERGRERLVNGALLDAAESAGLLYLEMRRWPILRQYVERVVVAVNAAKPGSFTEVEIPRK